MPPAVDQISKRYTVCLLCLHYKFSVFLLKMDFFHANSYDFLIFAREIKGCVFLINRLMLVKIKFNKKAFPKLIEKAFFEC